MGDDVVGTLRERVLCVTSLFLWLVEEAIKTVLIGTVFEPRHEIYCRLTDQLALRSRSEARTIGFFRLLL
jgi:hypothetical protein